MKGGRVLVVDDEPMVRETLGQVLADEGYVVDLASDGERALERVRAARPDAILLDLMMPGMNGRQFLQQLRAQPEYATVPVLIMTAVHGLNVNLATLGASEVVEKPFEIDELLNKVALAVYRSSGTYDVPPIPGTNPNLFPTAGDEPPQQDAVVLVVEHDRARLQQLDIALSARGYTVVTMTRAVGQLARLARALRPHAILIDAASEGVKEVLAELRDDSHEEWIGAGTAHSRNVIVFVRGAAMAEHHGAVAHASDADLCDLVDRLPAVRATISR